MAKKKKGTQENKNLLQKVRDRFTIMKDADEDNLIGAMENMKFVNIPGEQWDYNQKVERGLRPCYEFNKVRVNAKKVINHIRTNRPQGKIRGVEGTDKKQAEYREGLIRNIWNTSDGDTIMDYAAEYQVGGGMGAWRIITEEPDDNPFIQDIKVMPIANPFTLFHDPGARDMLKRDCEDWVLTEKIRKTDYERKYPDEDLISFEDHEFDDDDEWEDEDKIRIAEYWYKEPTTKELWKLDDGTIVDAESDEAAALDQARVQDKKTIDTHKIMMVIVSGAAIIEGPVEWAGTMFPFIKVFGEYMIVDGQTYWYGLGEFAKDAQRSYNVSRTAIAETIAMAPLEFDWVTPKQAEGHTDKWEEAHRKNFPFQMFNPDPLNPGPPQKSGGATIPSALIQESAIASAEIDEVMGIFPPDRGEETSQSGRAIYARQESGDTITFNYPDNMAKGVQRTYEILIDLIPYVLDTEREMRILGADGEEDYITFNQFAKDEMGQTVLDDNGYPIKINDLSVGRYDVTVTTGASFSTKRQEFVETFGQLFLGNEQMMLVYGDLLFKAMDVPFSDEMAERAKVMLPPQIQEMLNKDQQIPPEVQMLMQQAQQGMQMVEQQMQVVQQAGAEAEKVKNEAGIARVDVEKAISNLKTEQANFKTLVATFQGTIAKEVSRLVDKEAKLTYTNIILSEEEKAGNEESPENKDAFNDALVSELDQSVAGIKEMANQFNQAALKTLAEIQNKDRISRIDLRREDGQLSAVPTYENAQ